jgi:hypothetical protein
MVFDISKLPPEIQDQVYRPGADESYNVTVNVERPVAMASADEESDDGKVKVDLSEIESDQ